MWLLFAIELVMLIIVLGFEFSRDSHRSKPVFMMDVMYYSCLTILNFLFVCKYSYFEGDAPLEMLMEELIRNFIYFMLGILVIKFLWETFPAKWIYSKLFEVESDESENNNDKKEP